MVAPGRADSPPNRRSVLVVEDDPSSREMLAALLQAHGHDTIECADGRQALEQLRAAGRKPDVIVLDLMMPVMDGWTFRVEQKKDPAIASIPVLALSADASPKAAAIDANVYMSKPLEPDALLAAVDRLILQADERELQVRMAEVSRLTSLGTLAAGIAHEINNPLAYLMLNLDFLSKEVGALLADASVSLGDPARDRRVREMIEHIRSGGDRIRGVVQGILSFARPDLEKRGPVDLRVVLDSSIAMLGNQVRHCANLIRTYDHDVPPVLANEARLDQVFLNLLLNALQAIPDPTGDFRPEIHVVVKSEGAQVVAEVRDTGSGIAPDVLGRIFEPFFTTKPVGSGMGLGLAICHGIVTSMGGTITVTSARGQGSTFRVAFPAANARS